ncbi:MAG: adenosine deaminase [Hyphomonadaceae bacterium]
MQAYLEGMPKAELHLHLEGTLSPETIATMTNRNGLDYFNTAEEVTQSLADRPPGLMGFLQHHFKSQEVMQTGEDFHDAVYNLMENLHENNVVYADIFFDPQAHTSRGISFEEMFEGIDAGRKEGARDFGVKLNLIICIQRERSVESAMEMLDQAAPYRDRIIGLGMDSGPEYGNPPIKFQSVYARARSEGYYLTAHADVDVQDTLKHIWQLLNVIEVDRIDHGLNAVEDPALITALNSRGMCLTGSPVKRTTDPQLQDIDRISSLDQSGVCVSMHTDDPEEFDSGYLTRMMILFQQDSDYSRADMTRLMHNAYKALWLPEPEKQAYIQGLRTYAEQHDVNWSDVVRE